MRSRANAATILVSILFTSLARAIPVKEKRYDFDHNGIPDFCWTAGNSDEDCVLPNGALTTFATSTAFATHTPAPSLPSPSSSASTGSNLATGALPNTQSFQSQNGTSWTIESVGNLRFSGTIGLQGLGGDKGRSGQLGDKIIWNFGDMECGGDYNICGFSMGPAMYGDPANILSIDTAGVTNVNDALFATNYTTDALPPSDCGFWGMDNSNVAPINETTGIVLSWEIWRGCPNNGVVDRGLAASVITLGDELPTATRVAPLLTDGSGVSAGLLAIMAASDGYIYAYTVESGNVIVGRAQASNPEIFSSASAYEFLKSDGQTWTPGIPSKSEAADYNMITAQPGGWGCGVYGSVMYSNYFKQYMLFCNADEYFFNFYVSPTPYGPWSEQYQLLKNVNGYGSMAHPEYSPGGSHKELYISQGPNSVFNVWKVTFNYDSL